ncbi:MAG: hypothetical protein ACK56I_18310, partial [bacterium]
AETGNDRSDPQSLRIPKGFSGNILRNDGVGEPLGTRGDHPAVGEASGLSLLDEVIGAAAEKQVNTDTDIRNEEGAPRGLGGRIQRGIFGQFERTVVETGVHLRIPFHAAFVHPIVLERRGELGGKVARDFRGSAGDAPI